MLSRVYLSVLGEVADADDSAGLDVLLSVDPDVDDGVVGEDDAELVLSVVFSVAFSAALSVLAPEAVSPEDSPFFA
jgi:hypothetical protein